MRKFGFFPRLALVNLARNGRYYGPYLLSCGGVAAMYYILRFLTLHEALATVRGAEYLQSLCDVGCGVVALFAAVILFYANSFVMKRRQPELGLYNILGLEKRQTALVMCWETLFCAAAVVAGGILAGVLLSRLLLPAVLGVSRLPVRPGFPVSLSGIVETAALFAALPVLTLLRNLFRLYRARPVELLHGREAGEREPRTRRLLALIGLAALLGGYFLSFTVRDPVEAMLLFFLAVALVMIGTYCLFTAGSVALLKRLRANKNFYYRTNHFTAVSGLLYRMKQNAVGLANICILSTMVLVTVSTTVCLYLGLEGILDRMAAAGGAAREDLAEELYAMYGGFLFLGIFLGLLFLMTTVLIIYYKQISEGYEDQRRYRICRQVGMTEGEVRSSIHSQILLVFFLPLGTAAVHVAAAFPMLSRMLELFNLHDPGLFALCAAGTLLVFCAIYALVYGLTARAYDRIAGGVAAA